MGRKYGEGAVLEKVVREGLFEVIFGQNPGGNKGITELSRKKHSMLR
jgi:hypothetical protein